MTLDIAAPVAQPGQTIVSGPEKVRSEHWWRVRLADGTMCVLGRLLPELARDESLRRRYVGDAERRAALSADGLAKVLAIGPVPDARDPAAEPPWMLRQEPAGERLSEWLERRAPLPPDEALQLGARLCDIVHGVHAEGAVLRDLEPRNIVVADDGQLWLTDIGLARVDILSTRSASSLMLESSPYAAPEHLRATVVDHRADLYTVGAIVWQALTGTVPHAEASSFFGERGTLPKLSELGVDVPPGIEDVVVGCLADDAEARPKSARDVAAVLRGEEYEHTELAVRVACQSCDAPMRPGLRLCLSCGKQAVQFNHVEGDASKKKTYYIELVKAREDVEFTAKLRAFFETIGEGEIGELEFIVGNPRMYSKAERERLLKVPLVLISKLSQDTAERLAAILKEQGIDVRVRVAPPLKSRASALALVGLGGAAIVGGLMALGLGPPLAGLVAVGAGAVSLSAGIVRGVRRRKAARLPVTLLRKAPAALPASDPLIARISELLSGDIAHDVRECVSEIALHVQRLVDYRATHADDAGELAMVAEPIEPLVSLVCREAEAVARCDLALVDLDEGKLVRAIAKSEARREPRGVRVELLTGLDRLRELEDTRAAHMQHLLEASSLIRRAARLGLSRRDESAESERYATMALAALGGTPS